MRRPAAGSSPWRMDAWREAEASMARMNLSITRTCMEMERREYRWRCAGLILGGLLGLWLSRQSADNNYYVKKGL